MKLDKLSSQSLHEGDGESVRTDEELVLTFQRGDLDVFAEIYLRYCRRAEGVCRRYLRNTEDAKEAAQETMLRVFKALDRFNGDYALQAWVERIATNICFDQIRSAKRRNGNGNPCGTDLEQEKLNGNGEVSPDPSEAVEALIKVEEVREALSRLPEHHRTALVLREIEGRSHEEIGQTLGISSPKAKALIHRAKRSFRRIWSERRKSLRALIPPFLLPTKLGSGLSRVVPGLPELAAPATSSTTTTAVAGGERLIATVTIAVIAVGAVGITAVGPKSPPNSIRAPAVLAQATPEKGAGAEDAASQLELSPTAAGLEESGAIFAESFQKQDEEKAGSRPSQGEGSPAADTLASDTEWSPSPSPSNSPGGSAETKSAGPVPAWSLGFESDISTSEECGCDPSSSLWSSKTWGTAGEEMSFQQEAAGVAADREGDDAWRLWIEYWGEAKASSGTFAARFYLGGGRYGYSASGSLSKVTLESDGTYTYVYDGTFKLVDGSPEPGEPVPEEGSFTAVFSWWTDRTSLFAASFALTDS